jgi:signal transduction histidine kinase
MESLFAWANLQMDAFDVPLTTIDVEAAAKQAFGGVQELARTKGISLSEACGGLLVRAHPDMLSAVLRNLVSNAIKFSHPGGEIEVSASASGDQVNIRITDQGVGIPPEKIGTLFDMDRRSTTIGTAGERGGGLGLLLCHDLVERQGGTLMVSSVAGKGSTFSVALPRAREVDDDWPPGSGTPLGNAPV